MTRNVLESPGMRVIDDGIWELWKSVNLCVEISGILINTLNLIY